MIGAFSEYQRKAVGFLGADDTPQNTAQLPDWHLRIVSPSREEILSNGGDGILARLSAGIVQDGTISHESVAQWSQICGGRNLDRRYFLTNDLLRAANSWWLETIDLTEQKL